MALLEDLTMAQPKSPRIGTAKPADLLADIVTTTRYYEERVIRAEASNAEDAIQVVAKEIESDGLHMAMETRQVEPP